MCLDINAKLVANGLINSFLSGSTGILVLLHNEWIVCANVGDSRAGVVQLNGNEEPGSLQMLSRDHTPAEEDEKERIIKAGGKIMPCIGKQCLKLDPFGSPIGPPRIWDESGEGPGLMMSRSFGDQMGHQVGMTALPEVKFLTRSIGHKILVVGSDGLWEKTHESTMVNIGKKHIRDKDAAEKICKELVTTASNRWAKVSGSNTGMHVLPRRHFLHHSYS